MARLPFMIKVEDISYSIWDSIEDAWEEPMEDDVSLLLGF